MNYKRVKFHKSISKVLSMRVDQSKILKNSEKMASNRELPNWTVSILLLYIQQANYLVVSVIVTMSR